MFVLIFDRHDLWPRMSTFTSLLIDKEKDSIKSYKNNEYNWQSSFYFQAENH